MKVFFLRILPSIASNRSHRSLNTLCISFLIFGMIRSPPWTLPIPPSWRWTVCLPLFVLVRVSRHMWFFSCFLLQPLQGRQCLLEIRSMPQWHGIRTLFIWMKPPFALKWRYSCAVKWWVWCSSARASHRRQRSSSRWFSIIRIRNSWSRRNRSWIPWTSLFLHFFFNWLAV